jgi:hypothetical protein
VVKKSLNWTENDPIRLENVRIHAGYFQTRILRLLMVVCARKTKIMEVNRHEGPIKAG